MSEAAELPGVDLFFMHPLPYGVIDRDSASLHASSSAGPDDTGHALMCAALHSH